MRRAQVRDVREAAPMVQELPLVISAEAYIISAELRLPPPPPAASPRGKPGSPRGKPGSPRARAAPASPPLAAGSRLAAQGLQTAPPAPTGPAELQPAPEAAAPGDPHGPLLDFGTLRVRDAACRAVLLVNTGRHAVAFGFAARTQVCHQSG